MPAIALPRRQFLVLSGGAVAWHIAAPLYNATLAADRAAKWAPHPMDLVQWRYLAGRIADGSDDFGFVVTMTQTALMGSQQLLVQRKNLNGDQSFEKQVYSGTLEYSAASATYTFKDMADQTLATCGWSEVDQRYELTVTTDELTLNSVLLIPQGDLIAEGGDGEIQVGRIKGFLIDSDYHSDWANISVGGQEKGTARIDLQGLRLANQPPTEDREYSHHWFAIAVELNNETPAWISAWRIEALEGPFGTVTIARGNGAAWSIERSLTEGDSTMPLTVEVLEWQNIPRNGLPAQQIDRKWRLNAPDGSLNVDVAVPPGQFITDNPLSALGGPSQMQEAIGMDVTGTVPDEGIRAVKLAVAELTATFFARFLPVVFT